MVNNRKNLSKRKNSKRNRQNSSKKMRRKRVLSSLRRYSKKVGGDGDKPEKKLVTSMLGERRTDTGVKECHRHSPGCVKGKKLVGWDIDLWDCDPNKVPGDPDFDCRSPGPSPTDPAGPSKMFDLKGKKVSKWTDPALKLSPGQTETPFCCPYQASEILTEKGGFCRQHPCDSYLPIEK